MDSFRFWNIRGMNSTSKQVEISRFIKTNKVGLFGLLETKIKGDNWIKVKNKICDNWVVCTNTSYHKGGRI